MNYIKFKNVISVSLSEIPDLDMNSFIKENEDCISKGLRPLSLFTIKNRNSMYSLFADDNMSGLILFSTRINDSKDFNSLTKISSKFNMLERDFYERNNIKPLGHNWLKPIRNSNINKSNYCGINSDSSEFFDIKSTHHHLIGVGPVHAGIIEPGHFRFICSGEKVKHLEIQLGYQHRGIEKIILNSLLKDKIRIIESIAGDSVIANGIAYTNLIESLSDIIICEKAELIRTLALEMERIAIHIGDLSALANDIAYQPAASYLAAFRTLIINSLLKISGSRFGRGLLKLGGVCYDIENSLNNELKETFLNVEKNVSEITDIMFSQPSVISRFEHTGIVKNRTAEEIGLKGLPARASGIKRDIRTDHPFGIYKKYPYYTLSLESGDVYARAMLRKLEINSSIKYCINILNKMHHKSLSDNYRNSLKNEHLCVSMTESWRGELIHIAATSNKVISDYIIIDPSVNNWYGLAIALRENGISDFPLINKSFNLSYCGNDL